MPAAQQSFIAVKKDSHFPIQNLPYGVFQAKNSPSPRVGVAIGEQILDLAYLEQQGLLKLGEPVFAATTLNAFMRLGRREWVRARQQIAELLQHDNPELRDHSKHRAEAFVAQSDVKMLLPVAIGDYTDFYSSKEHASNVGAMFRDKNNPLLPNWLHLPVGYHGRASSVVVSGTPLHRPWGQVKPADAETPTFAPSKRLDFELEVACFIGKDSTLGSPVPLAQAEESIFGLVLMNDWSARDIQQWEYVPLGPFVSKSFGTTISPWVVTLEALEPFRVKGPTQDPVPLPYLREPTSKPFHFDIQLQVDIKTQKSKEPVSICQSNMRYLYWSMVQQIAHHTITGCNLSCGDLLASGTISGANPGSYGSLLELSSGGQKPLNFPNGETRSFLEDGDTVVMSGYSQGDGFRVGFGQASGTILAAKNLF